MAMLEIEGNQFMLLAGKVYLIGRKCGATVDKYCIALDHESLDVKHAIIDLATDLPCIYDLCSKMGTYLNAVKLEGLTKLNLKSAGVTEVRFGNVAGKIHLNSLEMSHNSSGFNDVPKNSSDFICSTPDGISQIQPRIKTDFLVPNPPATRTSCSSNISDCSFNDTPSKTASLDVSTDGSFTIPETQFCKARNSLNTSRDANKSEFCIPETQEIEPLQNSQMRKVVSPSKILVDNENATCSGSQFRICTQDFNEDCMEDDGSKISCNMLDNFQSPANSQIQHEALGLPDPLSSTKSDEAANVTASETRTFLDGVGNARDNACTPDLFDFLDFAQENGSKELRDVASIEQSLKAIADSVTTEATINAKPSVVASLDKMNDDEDDLMPTQVFQPKTKQVAIASDDAVAATPVYITLSDKENMLPAMLTVAAADADSIQATQKFLAKEVSVATNFIKRATGITSKPSLEMTECDDMSELEKTQIFSNKKATAAICPTNTAKSVGKCNDDFKKPDIKLGNKKAVSVCSTTASTHESQQSDFDSELLMCTPQLIKEQFVMSAASDSKDHNLTTCQKTLFGGDSDSEDTNDTLQLITAPKVSNDFDKLLPHLKQTSTSDKKQPEIDRKRRNFSNVTESKDKKKSSRDTRHVVRDKERALADSERLKLEQIEQTSKSENRKRKSVKDGKSETSAKTSKIEAIGDEVKAHTRSRRNTEKTSDIEKSKPAKVPQMQRRNTRLQTHTTTTAKKDYKQVAVVRLTRLKSEIEQTKTTKENNIEKRTLTRNRKTSKDEQQKDVEKQQKKSHTETEKSKTATEARTIRTRRTTETRERNKSHASTPEVAAKDNRKSMSSNAIESTTNKSNTRSRRSHSSTQNTTDESHRSLPAHKSKLKVAMTMVEPELFQNLLQNSAGLWTIAKDPADCDLLVMDKGNRTFKFLVAMARGIPIVTSKWLQHLNETKKPSRKVEHFFADASFERRHKFSLIESLELARKQRLFAEYEFLMTSAILPSPAEMQVIIECAGGTVHTNVPPEKPNQKLYLISSYNDKKNWHKYRRTRSNLLIISTEGVMASLMRQNVKSLELHLLA